MNVPPLRLEDFHADNANCGNCTRNGGSCLAKSQTRCSTMGISTDSMARSQELFTVARTTQASSNLY